MAMVMAAATATVHAHVHVMTMDTRRLVITAAAIITTTSPSASVSVASSASPHVHGTTRSSLTMAHGDFWGEAAAHAIPTHGQARRLTVVEDVSIESKDLILAPGWKFSGADPLRLGASVHLYCSDFYDVYDLHAFINNIQMFSHAFLEDKSLCKFVLYATFI
jgi:hypothetical protein